MHTIAIVKVAQGNRIPLTRDLASRMNVKKGDYVMICENDRGEITLEKPKPATPVMI